MSLQRDAERGQMAEDVLRNPVYADAYGQIEQEIYKRWREAEKPEDREHLHRLTKALSALRVTLESTMRSGKIAAKELQRQASVADRIGSALRRR